MVVRCTPVDLCEKACAVCRLTKNLLRCSRCKSVWYCGTKHQAKDWPFHQTVCSPIENRPKLTDAKFKNNDDEVQCGETRVSLRCPLVRCRINVPVRGSQCTHPQCVDLNTFLNFSHCNGFWQCPVCSKPLKFEVFF